ncbi:MAG: hypothetical protein H0W27_07460 [Actinobacteria bacterium]|nr:hypothetical protein [Actinomycetota bacterium]
MPERRRALPFIILRSTLFAILPGMEFALLAAAETGGDARVAQAALMPWFVPTLMWKHPDARSATQRRAMLAA